MSFFSLRKNPFDCRIYKYVYLYKYEIIFADRDKLEINRLENFRKPHLQTNKRAYSRYFASSNISWRYMASCRVIKYINFLH